VRAVLTRRRLLTAAAAVVASLGGAVLEGAFSSRRAPTPLGAQPHGLPARQHAWEASLAKDVHGNAVAPRFNRLLLFDLERSPDANGARGLEAAMRTLERRYPWGHEGLVFALGWGPRYFEHWLGDPSPVPHPRALSSFELPALDAFDVCLHLACDDERRLADVEAALTRGAVLAGADGPLDLRGVLRWRETRTGFAGAGLPAGRQHVGGIPPGEPVAADAPLFMGFKSGLRRNQASEDDVTIADGPWTGGTTMHVSYMRLRLDSWYGLLNERERVARMYAPQVTPEQVKRFTTDAASDPAGFASAARHYGVVGHAQASARARKNGKPRILRRDFDTVDGGEAGLHFVALQRTIADFVATRRAMNAVSAPYINPAITPTVNNGINESIFVLRRANYLVPSRPRRSFPTVTGALSHG
jgi:dye decolorizing peroxidase